MEIEEVAVEHGHVPTEEAPLRLPPPPEPYYSYNAPLAAKQKELAQMFVERFTRGKSGETKETPETLVYPLLLEIAQSGDEEKQVGEGKAQIDVKLPSLQAHGQSALTPLRHAVPFQQLSLGPYGHQIAPETYDKSITEYDEHRARKEASPLIASSRGCL